MLSYIGQEAHNYFKKGDKNMLILPAIDIKDNKCVRLKQGNFNNIKVYSNDPSEVAIKWQEQGAKYLHIVDLDGARIGGFTNKKSIEKILRNISIPVQIGGGIRSIEKVKELIDLGVDRVILGTAAVEDITLLKELIEIYGSEKIVISIDAKDGKVATRAWETISQIDSLNLIKQLEKIGVKIIVYTDISKDGMLDGPNFEIYEKLAERTSIKMIVSGGVTSMKDIERLKILQPYGVIIGKAFYEGILDFKEVI